MDNSFKILIIEDDAIDARFIKTVLSSAGYASDVAQHPNEALEALNEYPYNLVLVDLKMADMNGMQILELVKRYYPATEVIIITAHASIDTAVEAIRLGAYSYFVKGEPARKLIEDIKIIAGRQEKYSSEDLSETFAGASRLKARGVTFTSILSKADKISSAGMNVLLSGAPGTGRKALAQYMCKSSPKNDVPVYEIDFSTVTKDISRKKIAEQLNLFLEQHGSSGTFLLLNVDHADPGLLLEALSILEAHIPRYLLGSGAVSVVSTCSLRFIPDLKATYGSGFYFQYWGTQIELPGVKERREDLPLIVYDIVEKMSTKENIPTPAVDGSLLENLSRAVFVREFDGLEKMLQRLLEASSGAVLTSDLIEKIKTDDILLQKESLILSTEPSSLKEGREQYEREFIRTVYERSSGNKNRTAAALGISARQLYNMLNKYNIE